jgi:hypothetical protein
VKDGEYIVDDFYADLRSIAEEIASMKAQGEEG